MTISAVSNFTFAATGAAETGASSSGGLASLNQADFMRLMTVQMQHQDPFDPVDQKEMLAQMAQFSQLAGISEMGSTLDRIAARLDQLTNQPDIAE